MSDRRDFSTCLSMRLTFPAHPRPLIDSSAAVGCSRVLCAVAARTASLSRLRDCPIDEAKIDAGRSGELLKVPLVPRREWDLARHSYCSNQNVAKLAAAAAR